MEKIVFWIVMIALLTGSCNSAGKDSVERADSVNAANLDTALNRNEIVIDEGSSQFLVRAAEYGAAEEFLALIAHKKASYPDVQSFAAVLEQYHVKLNDSIKLLAAAKNIVLPQSVTTEKQAAIAVLESKKGKDLDKEFLKAVIRDYKLNIELFENAMLDAKDPEIRSFADKSLPLLKGHLDAAKELEKTVVR